MGTVLVYSQWGGDGVGAFKMRVVLVLGHLWMQCAWCRGSWGWSVNSVLALGSEIAGYVVGVGLSDSGVMHCILWYMQGWGRDSVGYLEMGWGRFSSPHISQTLNCLCTVIKQLLKL